MKLPDVFQFRAKGEPGFTHAAKLVDGKYQVKWARGFESYFMQKNNLTKFADMEWDKYTVQRQIENGNWAIVEDKKVKQELPDEFYIQSNWLKNIWRAVKVEGGYNLYMPCGNLTADSPLDEGFIIETIKNDYWKIINHKPLTPEQLRSNAEVQDQISALEHNIKLRKQDVEHAEILIANYEGRIKDLRSKLVKES